LGNADPFGDREIFNYWDGSNECYADPLVLQRELDKAGGENWTALLGMLKMGSGLAADVSKVGPDQAKANARQAGEAATELVSIVRKAFDVRPFKHEAGSATGLTDSECLDLLGQFFLYMQDLEEEATPSPSLPQSTASPTASSPTV
jgi:hypothetical protein